MSDRERVKDYSHYRFQLSNPCAQSFRIKRHVASGEESKQSILNFLLSLSLSLSSLENRKFSLYHTSTGSEKHPWIETVSIASMLSSKRLIKLKRLSCTKSWSWMIVAALDLER